MTAAHGLEVAARGLAIAAIGCAVLRAPIPAAASRARQGLVAMTFLGLLGLPLAPRFAPSLPVQGLELGRPALWPTLLRLSLGGC